MVQYVRPAQAFAAVSAAIAQNASPEATDLRNLHARLCASLGVPKGTTQYGLIRSLNTNERTLAIPDAVYAAAVLAGVDFSDARYNSTTAEGSYINTSEVPPMWNPGVHRQVIVRDGNSLLQSTIGAGTHTEFNDPTKRMWSQGVVSSGTGLTAFVTPNSSTLFSYAPTATAPRGPEYAYTHRWAHEKSRLQYNMGRDSGRLLNYGAYTYSQGYNIFDNFEQQGKLVVASGQQLVLDLFMAMSNDRKYADDNGNPGMGGASGTPNMIDDVLIPFLAKWKAAYPNSIVCYTTEAARSTATQLNADFDAAADRMIAQKATLGIDHILDSRLIDVAGAKPFSCKVPSNSTNSTYYQSDGVHFTPLTPQIYGPYSSAMWDKALGFTPDPAYAAAIR